jgi:hypothetical protein
MQSLPDGHRCPAVLWSTLVQALVTTLGWTGAVTCIVAYLLVSRGAWSPSSKRYQLTNVVGALLM